MESMEEYKERLYQEKLKRAEGRLAYRLVIAAIIFIVLFMLTLRDIGDFNSILQWLCIILFIGAGIIIVYLIFSRYEREKDDAIRIKQPNWKRKQK